MRSFLNELIQQVEVLSMNRNININSCCCGVGICDLSFILYVTYRYNIQSEV